MEVKAFQAGSQTPAGGLRHGPRWPPMLRCGSPHTGHARVVQTSLLLPTFNSEQQLTETKTNHQKSIGVFYKKELVRDIYPLADQELYEGTEPALMRGPIHSLCHV